MLIISIPKSASTSLLDTFGKLHSLPSKQLELKENPKAEYFSMLANYHPDTRQLSQSDVEVFQKKNSLFKQHILPTKHNLELLKNTKKVVLLRNPYDIVLAYRRGTFKGFHGLRKEFQGCLTEGEWIAAAIKNGLLEELKLFYDRWTQCKDDNTLLLHYSELVKYPCKSINVIEQYYGLPITSRKIKLSKKRYSHHSIINDFHINFRRSVMRYLIKHHYYDRLKNIQTYLRSRGISWM